jgi:hypothetical protein
MKQVKLIALICSLLLVFSFKAKAQEADKTTIMIGVYQSLNPEFSKIVVTENAKVVEEFKIDPTSEVSLVLNQIEVHKTCQSIPTPVIK